MKFLFFLIRTGETVDKRKKKKGCNTKVEIGGCMVGAEAHAALSSSLFADPMLCHVSRSS